MKVKDLFEGPYYNDDEYKPEIKRVATPTLAALKREYDHLGKDTVDGRKFDYWLSKTKNRALVTYEVDLEDLTRQIVTDLKFQPAPPEIPVENKLQVAVVHTGEDFRQLFLAGNLYVLLAHHNYSVISDFVQFRGGKGLWKSLSRQADAKKCIVKIWDEKSEDWIRDKDNKVISYNAPTWQMRTFGQT